MPHGEYQRLFGDNFLNYTGTIDFFLDTNLNLRLFFTRKRMLIMGAQIEIAFLLKLNDHGFRISLLMVGRRQ
jgi:hypothetical protein